MLYLLVTVASADSFYPHDGGFVSPARDDAPVDGVFLYEANFVPSITVTDSGGAVSVSASLVTGVGADPRLAILPPSGGWVPGQSYHVVVSSEHYGYVETPYELAFTAGEDPAPAAVTPQVGEVSVGEWSEETTYPWGCCEPVRTVEVEVEVAGADPWSWVEIVGDFDLGRPSQITTQEIHTHLATAVGPGAHTLSFVQWLDDRGPQPPCFDVVSMTAAGVPGPRETFCTDEDGVEELGAGCGGSRAAAVCLLGLVPLIRRRRG